MAKSDKASKPEETESEEIEEKKQEDEKTFNVIEIAEITKTGLQGFIAIGIVVLLGAKLLYHLDRSFSFGWDIFAPYQYLIDLLRLPTLELVGKALAYSAGIDLAYMLLTPGPDEAIEPLILGLASAILFSVSRIGETSIALAKEIGLYVIILSGLFFLKALFIPDDDKLRSKSMLIKLLTGSKSNKK